MPDIADMSDIADISVVSDIHNFTHIDIPIAVHLTFNVNKILSHTVFPLSLPSPLLCPPPPSIYRTEVNHTSPTSLTYPCGPPNSPPPPLWGLQTPPPLP